MSLYNMPPGCIDASDIDYYNRINPPRQCPGCKQEEEDCECCKECGAMPEQAHTRECGFEPPHASGCICADHNDYPIADND